MPVTVTVCGAAQFTGVNVRLVRSTVPSAGSLEAKLTETLDVGSDANTMSKVAEPPFSVVGPLIELTRMPAESLSVLMTSRLPGVIAA